MAKKFITLKEASDMSGYSPDYIGQLIRQGKLSGKQVYYNVAWVTTETAIKEYLAKANRKKGPDLLTLSGEASKAFFRRLVLERSMAKIMNGLLFFGMALSILVAFVSFYIISVSIDAKLEANALESIDFE